MAERWLRKHSNGWQCSVELIEELSDGNSSGRFVAFATPPSAPDGTDVGPRSDHLTVELAQDAADRQAGVKGSHKCDYNCTDWKSVSN